MVVMDQMEEQVPQAPLATEVHQVLLEHQALQGHLETLQNLAQCTQGGGGKHALVEQLLSMKVSKSCTIT